MMIDNLQLILPMLSFRSTDDFYSLQILQRKKENELLTSNSRVIKNYYIKSIDELLYHYPEIMRLCKQFNARASLRLNRRSFEQTAFHTLQYATNCIMNKDYPAVRRAYDRAVGQFNNEPYKKWILDVDDKSIKPIRIITAVKFCRPDEGTTKQHVILPTKSGYHIISSPFNVQQFKETSRLNIDIHKDNPVNLFIP